MKTQLLAKIAFSFREAFYIHDVLCSTPDLSPDAVALHDKLADGLSAIEDAGISAAEVTFVASFDLALLNEVAPLFGTRSRFTDARDGLDPNVGMAITETLIDTQVKLTRAAQNYTRGELANVINGNRAIVGDEPIATQPSIFNRIATFFSKN